MKAPSKIVIDSLSSADPEGGRGVQKNLYHFD